MKPTPPLAWQSWDRKTYHPGTWVAVGPHAWRFAVTQPMPVYVLPTNRAADHFAWPACDEPAQIVCAGDVTEERLLELAQALIDAGNPAVSYYTVPPEKLLDHTARTMEVDRLLEVAEDGSIVARWRTYRPTPCCANLFIGTIGDVDIGA